MTIRGDQFYWENEQIPMWGTRVASASQNEHDTRQLISVLKEYNSYGLHSISVYLQGSSGGFWDPFVRKGKEIDPEHLSRLKSIIEECRKHSMVVIVGIFYQRTMASDSLRNLDDEKTIYRAVRTVARELRTFDNVIINIANEQNSHYYKRFEGFNFNSAQEIIDLCRVVKTVDPDRIVGGGGYYDSLNVEIGKSPFVNVLLFDTFGGDVEKNQHSGWHYDHFKSMGVPSKPFINVELFGGWTKKFTPPGVYTQEGKKIHTQEIDEALKRSGLHVHLHSNLWMQGPSGGHPLRYDLGGSGTENDPGIRWWFEYLRKATGR